MKENKKVTGAFMVVAVIFGWCARGSVRSDITAFMNARDAQISAQNAQQGTDDANGTNYQSGFARHDQSDDDEIITPCYESGFRIMAEQINALAERSRTEKEISLHKLDFWDAPEEGNNWKANSNYRVSLALPDLFMVDEHKIAVDVNYPSTISKGDTGTITITAKDEAGDVRVGRYEITAAEDLHLAHGEYSDFLGRVIGDGMDIDDYLGAIVITFCTPADQDTEELPDDLAGRSGACPTVAVSYHRHSNI